MSQKLALMDDATPLTGAELAYVEKGGVQKRTTTGEIAALAALSSIQDERIRDVIGACLVAGAAVTLTVNDAGDTITIAVDTAAIDERARDALGTALVAGAGITITPNDGADTITVTCSITQYTDEMARDAIGAALVAGNSVTLTVSDAGDTITIEVKPGVQAVVSSATVTPTFADDLVKITAQAAALNLANPTGTAVPGKGLAIRIKDNGTARAIAYNGGSGSKYRAIGVTLPTTTVVNKTLYLGMIYNADDDKWDVVAVAQEA